jgi:hypothetical protein
MDADPANTLCPHCHTALHIPAAPTSPYAGGPSVPYAGSGPSMPYAGGPPPAWGGHEYSSPPYTPPGAPWAGEAYPTAARDQQYPIQQYPPGTGAEPAWASADYQILEPGAPPERSRSPWTWLVVAIAVILVGAGGAVAVVKIVTKHPASPRLGAGPSVTTGAPTGASQATDASHSGPDGKTQALAVDQLLNDSSASRQKLGPALTAVDGCGDVNSAVTTLQQVTGERDAQVKRGQALAVDQLTSGAQLRAALVQALTFSLQADQKFTAWAQAVAGAGCSGHATHDDNYTAAQTASDSATTNKQQFVGLWNPVAATYGLTTRSESTV